MTTATEVATEEPTAPSRKGSPADPKGLLIGFVGFAVVAWVMGNAFLALAYYPDTFLGGNQLVMATVGMIAGLGGSYLLFYFLNVFVNALPQRASQGFVPYAFVAPAFLLIGLMLLYPTIQTINYSFANASSTAYNGIQNYIDIFGQSEFWLSISNNALWLIFVPGLTVIIGIVVALFADRLSQGGEKFSKSLIFLPMAISFVAASTIWARQIYALDADTGLLNAIWTSLGGTAQDWIRVDTGRLNSFLLMVILIWMQAGFSMILMSGAIKGVPEETLEAARIDGATEPQIFFRVIIPQIKGTIITVFITVLIMVLKVFDIVYVTTAGQNKTNVIANLFYQKLFTDQDAGQASAIVVVLLILVTPVLIYQVRHYRKEQGR